MKQIDATLLLIIQSHVRMMWLRHGEDLNIKTLKAIVKEKRSPISDWAQEELDRRSKQQKKINGMR